MEVSFDFGKFVTERRGLVEKRLRDGFAYGFVGERRIRRTFASAKPVEVAIEGARRIWLGSARRELLKASHKATQSDWPVLQKSAGIAAERLGMTEPAVYVAPALAQPAWVLGSEDDPLLFVREDVARSLNEAETIALVGNLLGDVQNGHVSYLTALYYLRYRANMFVRWAISPASMALAMWARRAEITADRAALLACRDLAAVSSMIRKVSAAGHSTGSAEASPPSSKVGESAGPDLPSDKKHDVEGEAPAGEPSEASSTGKASRFDRLKESFAVSPLAEKRILAVTWFAETQLYARANGRSNAGTTVDELDDKVSDLLRAV